MKKLISALFLALATPSAALAFWHGGAALGITIPNFQSSTLTAPYQVSDYDTAGNMLDAHDGAIIQVESTFYKYGTANSCGFIWHVTTPYCGVKVYSSTDLLVWTYGGLLFDPTTTYWTDRCVLGGCFNPRMVYNAANNNYVLWINQQSLNAVESPALLLVMTCTTPTGPCTSAPDPSHFSHGSGDFSIAVDTDGTAYIGYNGGDLIYVEKLNSSYTDSTGSYVSTGQVHEGVGIFIRAGHYYVVYGPGCPYCNDNPSYYVSASSALGTYSAPVLLNATSCGGQSRAVDPIVADGQITYLYHSDLWSGNYNEGSANEYYQPLTFTGAAINPFACAQTVGVPGLSPTTPPAQSPTPDQTSLPSLFVNTIASTLFATAGRMQTFVPTSTTLSSVKLALGQTQSGLMNTISGTVTIALETVDGSNNPVSVLATNTINSSAISWAQAWTSVPLSHSLSIGTPYAIVITSNLSGGYPTVGLYTGSGTNPYPAGVERYYNGSAWVTETGRAIMFSTFP